MLATISNGRNDNNAIANRAIAIAQQMIFSTTRER